MHSFVVKQCANIHFHLEILYSHFPIKKKKLFFLSVYSKRIYTYIEKKNIELMQNMRDRIS